MLRILVLSTIVFFSFIVPASAGVNEWTPSRISRGGTTSITFDAAPSSSPILETRMCSSGVVWTDDTDVTFDLEICRAGDAASCTIRNETSPLDAETYFGAEFDITGSSFRLSVASIVGYPTFTFDCMP